MKTSAQSFVAETPRQRVDVFLAGQFPQLSRSHLKKLIALGAVRVGGELTEADRRLRVGAPTPSRVRPTLQPAE